MGSAAGEPPSRLFIDAFRSTSRSCFLVTNVNRSVELRFMAMLARQSRAKGQGRRAKSENQKSKIKTKKKKPEERQGEGNVREKS